MFVINFKTIISSYLPVKSYAFDFRRIPFTISAISQDIKWHISRVLERFNIYIRNLHSFQIFVSLAYRVSFRLAHVCEHGAQKVTVWSTESEMSESAHDLAVVDP